MCNIRGLTTSGVPIGTMHDFGQAVLPFGFVACDSAIVSQTGTYAKLFAAIGSTYNTGGEGGGNFRLPGSIGRTRVMPGSYTDPVSGVLVRTAGQILGAEKHAMTGGETGSHTHSISDPGHGHSLRGGGTAIIGIGVDNQPVMGATAQNGFYNGIVTGGTATGITGTNPTAASTAHNNMQPSLVIGNVGISYI